MNFSEKLKEIRIEKQLTQAELAASIGITVTTVNRWENGGHMPGYRNICNIANALNISALDFLDDDNTNKDEQTEIRKAHRMQKNWQKSSDKIANKWADPEEQKEVKQMVLEGFIEYDKNQMQALDQLETVLHTLTYTDYDYYFPNSPKSEEKKETILKIVNKLAKLNKRSLNLIENIIDKVLIDDSDYSIKGDKP